MRVHPRTDEQEWRHAAAVCPHATFFQTPEWFATFASAESNWKAEAFTFEFDDGGRAIFPFLSRRKPRLPGLWISGPAGVYGGWISSTPLLPAQQQSIINFITARNRAVIWRMNPYAELNVPDKFALRPDHTTVLDLTPGFTAVFANWSENHRRGVTHARKRGVQVRRAATISDWQGYFACYQDSLLRWGKNASSQYDWNLFKTLSRLPESNVSLWLAEREGRVQAGAICFSHRLHTVYWHGAAYSSAFPDRPVHFLMHEIIRDACEKGGTCFDFNPSGGHEGVERFKKGFGGRLLSSPVLDTRRLSRWNKVKSLIHSHLNRRVTASQND